MIIFPLIFQTIITEQILSGTGLPDEEEENDSTQAARSALSASKAKSE